MNPFVFHRNENYLTYNATTSPLMPLPPACFGAIPAPLKCLFCCECPFYNYLDDDESEGIVIKTEGSPPVERNPQENV